VYLTSANDNTLAAIEAIINETLRLSGSTLKASDIVTLSISEGDEYNPAEVVCTPKMGGSEVLANVIKHLKDSFSTKECMC